MFTKRIVAFVAGMVLAGNALAQNIVSVNQSTGIANVDIPIYTVTSGQVAVPISISYAATGVKTRDVENTAGMGWQMVVGGQVTREVRGLPDDITEDNSGATAVGWMQSANSAANYASTFTPQNDDNSSTCTDETNDITNINGNMPYNYDTEPDIFTITAPGLSCQLVWDRTTNAFHPLIYKDLVVQYTTIGGTGTNATEIASFTVINDKGIKYVFSQPESVFQITTASGTPNYFGRKYNQYKNGIIYYSEWDLTSITDAYGNGVTFGYTAAPPRGSTDPVILFIGGGLFNRYNIMSYSHSHAKTLHPLEPSTLTIPILA
jgi:hypothetical protein